MAKVSVLDLYKDEIEKLIQMGVSVRSAWRIISSKMNEETKITYNGFYRYCRRNKIGINN